MKTPAPNSPASFLNALARALSAMTLYRDGHPQRDRAVDAAYDQLVTLQSGGPLLFTFLDDEVVFGKMPVRELRGWDWSPRFAAIGMQRLEFSRDVARDAFDAFLDEVLTRLSPSALDTSEARQMADGGIKFGAVGVREEQMGAGEDGSATEIPVDEEADAILWLHDEVREHGHVPMAEAESVVRSLALAMHGARHMIFPLLQLKEFDQYTATHSLNVSVLAMGLAEALGMGAADVRAFGVAGLLHDVGKVRIPRDLLVKPGKLTREERDVIRQHPAEGARIILRSNDRLEVAAVVAYEHHIMLNGRGYPHLHYGRNCHHASELVHVCDIFDALRTNRPYRDAWPLARVLPYLEQLGGRELNADLARAFTTMMAKSEMATAVVKDDAALGSG
jgi:putative nucleotidyltransferase with HDIG domain